MKLLHYIKSIILLGVIFWGSTSYALSNYVTAQTGAVSFNDKYGMSVNLDLRGNEERLFRHHYDVGVIKRLSDRLSFAFRYRHIYLDDGDGWYFNEIRPAVQVWGLLYDGDWQVHHRVRHTVRLYQRENSHENRSQIKVALRPKKRWKGFLPVISNESYIEIEAHRYSQNRIEVGADYYVLPSLKVTALYRNDASINDDLSWAFSDIVVLFFKWTFH